MFLYRFICGSLCVCDLNVFVVVNTTVVSNVIAEGINKLFTDCRISLNFQKTFYLLLLIAVNTFTFIKSHHFGNSRNLDLKEDTNMLFQIFQTKGNTQDKNSLDSWCLAIVKILNIIFVKIFSFASRMISHWGWCFWLALSIVGKSI